MKVLSIGQNVDLANQIYKFTEANCGQDRIQFIEDDNGNLFITQETLNNQAFQKFQDELIIPITDYGSKIDFAPARYVGLERVNPSKFQIEMIGMLKTDVKKS